MAQNFEIIFPREEGKYLVTEKGTLNKQKIQEILNAHSCDWVMSPHEVDEMSSFQHWHVGIHTNSNNEYESIAKWFGLKANSVQKIKGKFTSTYLLYIVHEDKRSIKQGKTKVPYELVESNFDIDYNSLVENTRRAETFDDKLDQLANGEISEFDLYQSESVSVLRKNIKKISDALVTRSKKAKVQGRERDMQVVYITGKARTGKSYLAKKLAKQAGYSVYETSNGKNPFDDYMGQDTVIVDDIRASDFKFNEFLKITDNHMSAMVSARYHNIDLNCKCMYLTSIVPLSEFYENLRKENDEASEQIKGRIGMLVEVSKKYVDISVYDDATMTYKKIVHNMPNPILTDKDIQQLSVTERADMVKNMFKGIADLSEYAVDYVDKHQMSLTEDFMPIPEDDPFED